MIEKILPGAIASADAFADPSDALLFHDVSALTKACGIQHVQRHPIDIDTLADHIAGSPGNWRNNCGFVAGEFVEQTRLTGVGATGNHHGHSFA